MSEPEITRAVHQPVTEDDKALLDAALERTQGNRAHAARLLGWAPSRIYNIISDHADMRAKWSRTGEKAPVESLSLSEREPADAPSFSSDEQKAALALARQDKLMAKSWTKLGLKENEQEFLRTLQNSYAVQFKSTSDLIYGGVVHMATRLLLQFEQLVEKIRLIDEDPDEFERSHNTEFGVVIDKTAHEFRHELYSQVLATASEMRKLNVDLTKMQYVRAQLAALGKTGASGGKPSWGKGAPPVSVTVNTHGGTAGVTVGPPEEPDAIDSAVLVDPQ